MSNKSNFSLRITTVDGSTGHDFSGDAACNMLQALYGPEFCILLSADTDAPQHILMDRNEVTVKSHAAIVGANQPDSVNHSPRHIADNGGLYIHHSVIPRLHDNLCRWNDTDTLFNDEYGFGASVPLKNAVEEFVKFARSPACFHGAYAGIVRWG